MDNLDMIQFINGLSEKLNGFESGDLMSVVEIKNGYLDWNNRMLKESAPPSTIKKIEMMVQLSEKLSNPEDETAARDILLMTNQYFIDSIQGAQPKDSLWDDAVRRTDEILNRKSVQALEQDKEKLYEGFFNNIVDDKKMLSQLCEEVKEHLDTAQFTLVDLEYDDTNQENINKVFRSFHTIKGSSAFLGLRNFEEIGHEMENLLVLVRDGKLRISKELIDVIFMGIELLRNLIHIMETQEYDIEKMTVSFKKVDIFSYTRLVKKILAEYTTKKIGEILQENNVIKPDNVKKILKRQETSDKKFGEIAVEEKYVSEQELTDALKKQTQVVKKSNYVKVSNDRLNALIDIVGELVINQSMLKQVMQNRDDGMTNSERTISQMEIITTTIKNLVLSMGMVPVAEVFNKLRVVARNTSKELGKAITLEITGEDTELDRNVIENIYDPLVHMVRNSADHGIESPGEREKQGKDKVGKIVISAEHKGNGIEISVYDDGRGIDKEQIVQKALTQNLIPPERRDNLSDKEIYGLMFQPGFSTAQKVSEISGRGVGLDVVRKNIEEIRGRVDVLSIKGQYTKFVIKLPLTLAIIEGFVTQIGFNKYVFPFNMIEEIIVPQKENLKAMEDGNMMFLNRGNYIPVVFAGKVFHEEGYTSNLENLLLIIINYDNRSYGIVVDRIIGKQEIVIKSLGDVLADMSAFSGGTIFGDGTIGFVVDIEGFLEGAKTARRGKL